MNLSVALKNQFSRTQSKKMRILRPIKATKWWNRLIVSRNSSRKERHSKLFLGLILNKIFKKIKKKFKQISAHGSNLCSIYFFLDTLCSDYDLLSNFWTKRRKFSIDQHFMQVFFGKTFVIWSSLIYILFSNSGKQSTRNSNSNPSRPQILSVAEIPMHRIRMCN